MTPRAALPILGLLMLILLGGCGTKTGILIPPKADAQFVSLFNGTTLEGWEGDPKWFRVEDGAIVAGSLDRLVPDTVFLSTTRDYHNFDLTYEVKLVGSRERGNGGVQIRSQRIPESTHVRGYQVDVGQHYWGRLYDESRRRKILTDLPEYFSIDTDVNHGGWNRYRVWVYDDNIKIWLNDTLVADYNETDPAIVREAGFIAVQAHAGPPTEIWYRDLLIRELD